MKKVKRFWDWADGKKTLWGAVIFFAAVELQRQGFVDTALVDQWLVWAEKVGEALAVIGLVHKGKKQLG